MEYEVTFGRENKRADVCVFDAANTTSPYILVEVKKPKLKDGKEQLKSYCNATGAPMGVWSNGGQISFYHRKDPNYFECFESEVSAHAQMRQIENHLTARLNLKGWQLHEPLAYVQSSATVRLARRFDAEYFCPAKQTAQSILANASEQTVSDQFESVRELWLPDGDESEDEARNYDLNDALAPFLEGKKPSSNRGLIASTKKRIREGDLVVSRLRSYLKEIAIVESGGELPMVASTEFIVLRPKLQDSLPVEALMVYLRSALPQLIFKWSQDGSNHPRFDERELLRLPIPRALIGRR